LLPHIDAPPASTIVTALVIWVLTWANIKGPRVVGLLETWTMTLALIPIVAIAVVGWWWFDPEIFKGSWNVSGDSDWSAISRAASMVLWAYMGIESAAVSAGVIENPSRNIPLATITGLVLAAVVYILSSTVIMGIMPAAQLQGSHAPFAEVARIAIGAPAAIVISICAVLKSVGSLGGWMLLVGQSAKAAADDGMFPKIFGRLNAHGVPSAGLIIVSALMTLVLFGTMSPTIADQFSRAVDLAVVLIIVPYVYSAIALINLLAIHRGVSSRSALNLYRIAALAAVFYCLWAMVGGEAKTVMHAFVALLISVPLYLFVTRRTQPDILRKPVVAPPAPMENLKGTHARSTS
jgi:arginine:agmatine antiporter